MIDPSTSAHYVGDCRTLLQQLPDGCVQTCITSPPYWGLRDYGVDGQIGLEASPEAYIEALVDVFREVRRSLADDGTLWLNLGDSYSHGGCGTRDATRWPKQSRNDHMPTHAKKSTGLKPKDLVGIPWMAAFALRADGWYLRSDIIWHKPNPMPESVTDRPTKAHEYIFLLSKSESYFYDHEAIKEPCVYGDQPRNGVPERDDDKAPGQPKQAGFSRTRRSGNKERKHRVDHGGPFHPGGQGARRQAFGVPWEDEDGKRNKRSVWTICSKPYSAAHFAVFPPELVDPCVLAGSRPHDLVLDPFFGSGTTGQVAEKHGRRWIGFDLNPAYGELAKERTAQRSLTGWTAK